jgi:hypothetical protein
MPITNYSIVRVKKLDYSGAELPEEKDRKSKAKKLIKELMKLEGRIFYVTDIYNQAGEDNTVTVSYRLEGIDSIVKIEEEQFDIIMLEEELEVLYSDYLNNCCREYFTGSHRLKDLCPVCSYSFPSFVKKLSEENKKKTKTE